MNHLEYAVHLEDHGLNPDYPSCSYCKGSPLFSWAALGVFILAIAMIGVAVVFWFVLGTDPII